VHQFSIGRGQAQDFFSPKRPFLKSHGGIDVFNDDVWGNSVKPRRYS
jgi:hypothetical protein